MKYKVVCFDLDGTLIEDDEGKTIWMRISDRIGKTEVDNIRRNLYREGKITTNEWTNQVVKEWRELKVTRGIIDKELIHVKLNPGSIDLIQNLKQKGYKIAIVSGSFDYIMDSKLSKETFDYIFISKLFFNSEGEIIDWYLSEFGTKEGKADALKKISENEQISLSQIVFVGDDVNDVAASMAAGFSIAYNPHSEELKRTASVVLPKVNMTEILKYIE